MPLTLAGKKTLKNFQKEYGKEEGESYFYGWLNEKSKKERRKYEHIDKKR
jgi:translation elongation factor EF-1alpha